MITDLLCVFHYMPKNQDSISMNHVLIVTLPSQGHINPTLQLAKRLINMGVKVTFATSIYALGKMAIAKAEDQVPDGLAFVEFSDGFDQGFDPLEDDINYYMSESKARGSEALRDTIFTSAEQGRPVTCLVYTVLLPWASQVAQEANVPCALLWTQAATVLSVYYWYFHGFREEIDRSVVIDDSYKIQLPGVVTSLSKYDIPSFLLPSTADMSAQALISLKEHFLILDEADNSKPSVLVNTFDALEPDTLKAIQKYYNLIAIGPLTPSTRLDKSFRGDLFEREACQDWLNSNPRSSVVYISFGSLITHQQAQIEEIAKGLLECGRPFLWVLREKSDAKDEQVQKISCISELEKLGRIVPWCSQLEVLAHPSLGCFVTHCGWNSTIESISSGVPVVAVPQWSDQRTNAKLIEDVWKTGVRVRVNGERGLVESSEIWRCIEEVMDSKEVRENATKWKHLAAEALQENGSSSINLKGLFGQG